MIPERLLVAGAAACRRKKGCEKGYRKAKEPCDMICTRPQLKAQIGYLQSLNGASEWTFPSPHQAPQSDLLVNEGPSAGGHLSLWLTYVAVKQL